MALYTMHMLTDEYGVDQQITQLVNSREIWIVFDMNPDGGEYDIATGTYQSWRKNRQPNSGSIGTDLNRNWGYKWGCCGGSSSTPSSETYGGAAPFSAPETDLVPPPDGFAQHTKPAHEDAVDFMIETIHRYPHEVTILEIAPPTNLALAIRKDPTIVPLIKQIITMGRCEHHF